MPTITQQNALIQKKALAADPSISFGNLQYNNPGVQVAGQSPGGFSMSATMFPSQTDSTGKADPKAVQFADNITQGLQQQQYGDDEGTNNSWWDNLQNAIGSMGVGPNNGGGTYVPYTQQQLDYEKQENAQNQAYGQQYMDYLTGKNTIDQEKVDKPTTTQAKTDALSKVQQAISSWHDQGYTQAQVEKMIDGEANVLTQNGVTPAQAHAYAVQLYKDEGTVVGKPGPPSPNPGPPAPAPTANTGGLLGLIKSLL